MTKNRCEKTQELFIWSDGSQFLSFRCFFVLGHDMIIDTKHDMTHDETRFKLNENIIETTPFATIHLQVEV